MTGSISVSGLLGGTAGSIDVTSLVTSLMTAEAVPQNELNDQLTANTSKLTSYQSINTDMTAVQTAAAALLSTGTAWSATAATSSNSNVVATSSSSATAGSTTFDVTSLAASQISTVAADASGNVVSDPSAGITITGADGNAHNVSLTSGSAASVAAAINKASVGVKAAVVQTDSGQVLQLTSSTSGTAHAFTASGFSSTANTIVSASNAQLRVGGTNGYTVSSATNTFSNAIPGVTLSVGALATGVTVNVASDATSISNKVAALVTAVNTAHSEIASDTAQGAGLQGSTDLNTLANALVSAVSSGVSGGGSLSTYGIDVDSTGKLTFDADTFASAYAADPTGTQNAIAGSFASSLSTTATGAVDKISGSLTTSIASITSANTQLTGEISDWTDRLATIKENYQAKFTAMETALASLQTTQSYLTSMFDSITNSQSSSS